MKWEWNPNLAPSKIGFQEKYGGNFWKNKKKRENKRLENAETEISC